ncbi:hypothetical protein OAB73_01305, partial [Crocinitomicaceae bacterium]|nr:hypothetical protein [Crocinitomicaceae bacterium]
QLKDSIVNESLSFFNEIQENLLAIGVKEESVRQQSGDTEIANNEREMVLNEIRQINNLRTDNAKKMTQLQDQMKNSGMKIIELEAMVNRLMHQLADKDAEIQSLQKELEQKNKDFARLFDAYQEKDYQIDLMKEDMNTAYYVYGTEKELLKNEVISKNKGFVGVGRKVRHKEDFNENYFTKIDKRSKKDFLISGDKIELISTHPTSSYDLIPVGENTKLVVKDAKGFWKVSQYLIVVVK